MPQAEPAAQAPFGRDEAGRALVSCPAFVQFARATLASAAASGKTEHQFLDSERLRKPWVMDEGWSRGFSPWFKDLAHSPDDTLVPLRDIADWVAAQVSGCTAHRVANRQDAVRSALSDPGHPMLLIDEDEVLKSGATGILYVGDQPLDLLPHYRPGDLADWRLRLSRLNPRSLGACEGQFSNATLDSDAARSLAAEIGAAINADFANSLKTGGLGLWDEHVARHRLKRVTDAGSSSAIDRQRTALHQFLRRPFDLDLSAAWIPLVLRSALRSSLLALPLLDGDLLDVVANVGAGHLLRIHVLNFPGDKPQPLRSFAAKYRRQDNTYRQDGVLEHCLDGGDVIAILEPSTSSILEGSSVSALASRKAAASGGDDDDDDFGDAPGSQPDEDDMCDDYGSHPE